jgi:hypothetical protein
LLAPSHFFPDIIFRTADRRNNLRPTRAAHLTVGDTPASLHKLQHASKFFALLLENPDNPEISEEPDTRLLIQRIRFKYD